MSKIKLTEEKIGEFKWLELVRRGDTLDHPLMLFVKYITFDYGIAYEMNEKEIRVVKMDSITEEITNFIIEKALLKEVYSFFI